MSNDKKMLFEAMHKVTGMPLNENEFSGLGDLPSERPLENMEYSDFKAQLKGYVDAGDVNGFNQLLANAFNARRHDLVTQIIMEYDYPEFKLMTQLFNELVKMGDSGFWNY